MKKIFTLAFIAICLPFSLFAQNNWYTYSSKEMGFKIDFPKQPAESSQMSNSDLGLIKINMVILDLSSNPSVNNIAYMADYCVYPDSAVNWNDIVKQDAFFDRAVNAAVKNVNGKLISVKKITFKNIPGREAKIDWQQSTVTARFILVKNRFYGFMVFSSVGKDNNPDATKFLESFDFE